MLKAVSNLPSVAGISLIGLLIAMPVQAATAVAFTSANGTSVPADVEGPGVTGFNLARSTGLTQAAGGTFNSNNWTIGGNKGAALLANDAIFWGFNSTIGYDLTSLSFGYDRSPTGPTSIAVDFFAGGASQGEIFADTSVADDSTATATIDLTAFDDVMNGFFRLSGWGATGSTGTFDIENRIALDGKGIVLTGELTVVPLPAAVWLFASALGVLGYLGKRRQAV